MKTAKEILSTYESFHFNEEPLDETHYYKDNVLLAMEEYASQSKWISVKLALPKIGKDKSLPDCSDLILLYGKDYKGDKPIEYKNVGYYELGEFISSDGDNLNDDDIKVTHWQPLPEKP